jgi:hypothetical protein
MEPHQQDQGWLLGIIYYLCIKRGGVASQDATHVLHPAANLTLLQAQTVSWSNHATILFWYTFRCMPKLSSAVIYSLKILLLSQPKDEWIFPYPKSYPDTQFSQRHPICSASTNVIDCIRSLYCHARLIKILFNLDLCIAEKHGK